MNRRVFIQTLTALSSSGLLSACSNDPEPGRYTALDIQLLAEQQRLEKAYSGKSRFGEQRYRGYRGLAELPWFELNQEGHLICSDDSLPRAIDAHCHLGMSVLFKPHLDLHKPSSRTQHLLDCDAKIPGCSLDLDVYVNANFTDQDLDTLQSQITAQGLWGSQFARTQTIPNLLQEMDAMRVEQAILLPIKLGFWFGDDLTESWRQATQASKFATRLKSGFSIHPRQENRLEQLAQYSNSGVKIMKLHPTVQRFYPDDEKMMTVYALAEKLGVVIFFHGGRAGIEPESSHRYAMPRHYEAVLANFPKLQCILGHAGARDHAAMFKLARRYENAWLGLHGQSITNLDKMIQRTDGERLLFGTDWPFYHIAPSLAKVLIATQDSGMQKIRKMILRDNARQLFSAF